MKKKMYEKPTTKVFELKQQPQLLAGSVQSTRSDYGEAQEYDWE